MSPTKKQQDLLNSIRADDDDIRRIAEDIDHHTHTADGKAQRLKELAEVEARKKAKIQELQTTHPKR